MKAEPRRPFCVFLWVYGRHAYVCGSPGARGCAFGAGCPEPPGRTAPTGRRSGAVAPAAMELCPLPVRIHRTTRLSCRAVNAFRVPVNGAAFRVPVKRWNPAGVKGVRMQPRRYGGTRIDPRSRSGVFLSLLRFSSWLPAAPPPVRAFRPTFPPASRAVRRPGAPAVNVRRVDTRPFRVPGNAVTCTDVVQYRKNRP